MLESIEKFSSLIGSTFILYTITEDVLPPKELGYKIYNSSKFAKKKYYDVVTLFHVFEHMKNPIKELKVILQYPENYRTLKIRLRRHILYI